MAIHYEDGACGNFTQSDDFWLKLWAMFGTAPFTADTLKTVTLDAKKLFPKKCCTMLAQSQAIQNGSQKKDDDKLVNVTLLSDVESRLVTKELNDAAAKWGSSDPTLTIEKYDSPSNKCSSIPKTLFKLFFAALYASYDAYNAGIALDCLGWGTAGFVVGIAGNALCTGATGYYAAEEVWRLCENTFCSRNEDIHKKEVKKVSQKLRNITAKQQEIDREKFNAILKESKLDGSTLDEIDIYNHLRKQGTKKQAHPCCIPARKNTLQGLAIMGYTAFAAVSMASIFSSQAYIKMAETLGIGINGTEISYTALNGTISQLCDAASRRTLLILTPEDYSTLLLGGTWATTSYLAQGAGTTIILVKTIRDGVRLYHILKDPESRAIFFSRPIAEQVFDVAGLTLMSGFLVGYLWNIAGTYYPALQSTYLSQCLGWISPPAWLKVGVGMASLAGTFIKGGPSMSNGLNHLVHHFYHTAPDLADTMTEQAKAQGIPLNPGKHYPLVHGNPQPGIELVD
ncbi:hypothetical protein [Endozoicomonas sp. Mp262]|uniref:hypothetical protein n=1 Tax=Endozoicomonas sp. Mp262 TaxID=2919499 RepID=UPI0021D9C278